jgi:hypothetical protein
MSANKLQAMRDSLARGDDVLVSGHGHATRRARVVEVLRAAVRIRYHDGQSGEIQTVLFRQITKEDATTPGKPKPAAATLALAPSPAAPVAAATPAAPAGLRVDELDVWLDMGRDMADRMRAEIAALEANEESLRADAKQLFELAEQAEKSRQEMQRKLQAVIAITGAAAS